MPDKFGGGAAETTITAVSLALLLIAAALALFLPRKYAIVAILGGILFIPSGNVFVVAGVHLLPVRVLSLVGCIRLLIIKLSSNVPIYGSRWTSLDTLFVMWGIWRSLSVILLWQTTPAIILECGHLWAVLLTYLVLRGFIVDEADAQRTIKLLAIVAIVSSIGMVYEQIRMQNLFGTYLGGLETAPAMRDGRVRAQGLFRHAILGGSYGATMIPLVLTLWRTGKSNAFVVITVMACLVSVLASASSTPIGAAGGLVVALAFWPARKIMKLVRWSVVLGLLALDMVMKAPVWFIIARVSFVSGSTADFRAHLIDEFIRHFSDWFLLGIKDSNSWGESMWDYSNQFVAEGLTAGILGFAMFIGLLKKMYSSLGNARKSIAGNRRLEWILWLLGCAIFTHMNAWLGVSYWDNSQFCWFALIAIIITTTQAVKRSAGSTGVRAHRAQPMREFRTVIQPARIG